MVNSHHIWLRILITRINLWENEMLIFGQVAEYFGRMYVWYLVATVHWLLNVPLELNSVEKPNAIHVIMKIEFCGIVCLQPI